MAIETFPSGVTQTQFIGALKYVMLREAARVENGIPGLAAIDAFLASGGTYESMPEKVRNAVDPVVEAGMQGALPGMRNGKMHWAEWACFCRYYVMLDLDAAETVRKNMEAGLVDPWNVETEGGRTTLPSPLSPCSSKASKDDMFCCPLEVRNDAFYAGSMPGKGHGYSLIEWILIGAGGIAAASAVVWVGSDRGWFGKKRSGRR